ncbi:hypothetical protein GGX14DRAFT_555445 [Mycena pura]|uniref:Uncharacterized protein n=1 Tax=Mycena pura TaxID=153505 RepID=A0AAD6YRN9_9AGAR|nr:hypothetical protein GGX14DRAFT_555445 [Mycena pura]
MNTRSEAGFSRNSSVSWGTKIKGAIQVGHGLGDAIRGSLGASDFGHNKYTTSNEIAQRGRHEIAEGLARIKGAAAVLPSAPLYDRRHSYPVQQYASSVWNRRSISADRQRPNPPTAADPFGKFYEQPYPAEQDQDYDPGFAGLGAGIDPATRKQRNDRIRPAFLAHPPSASAIETRYPASGNSQASTMTPGIPPQLYLNPARNPVPASISSGNSLRPPSAFDRVDQQSTLSADAPRSEQPSARRRSLSMLVNRTRKSMAFTGKGKSKATSNENEDGSNTSNTRLYVPDPHAIHQARSAPPTPPPHQHESALECAGYDVLSYDAKDPYPQWPSEGARGGQSSRSGNGGRLEPVRSMRIRS